MKYKKMETCTSVIFHLTKSIDVRDFANILIKEFGYKKTGEIATNIELTRDHTYVIIGKKTVVVEGDDKESIKEIEELIKTI